MASVGSSEGAKRGTTMSVASAEEEAWWDKAQMGTYRAGTSGARRCSDGGGSRRGGGTRRGWGRSVTARAARGGAPAEGAAAASTEATRWAEV